MLVAGEIKLIDFGKLVYGGSKLLLRYHSFLYRWEALNPRKPKAITFFASNDATQ